MHIALWITAGLLALVALTGGLTKTFVPLDKLSRHDGAAWTRGSSPTFVRTLGVLEILGQLKIEGELPCRPEQLINGRYIDPDGTEVWCANTEIGDARLTVYRRSGLRWREHRTLVSEGRAHFEHGGRERDPRVTHEHVLVR